MWHNKYAILQSWFGDDSEYSILKHTGVKGFVVSQVLDKPFVFRVLMVFTVLLLTLINLPMVEYVVNRTLVSATLWEQWPKWARVVHAALPLQLLLAQHAWKQFAKSLGLLESKVREYIVELECAILEERVPLTVGPGSEDEEERRDEVAIDVDDHYDSDDE